MSITISERGGKEQFNRKMRQLEWKSLEEQITKAMQFLPSGSTPVEIFLGKSIPRLGATSGKVDGIPWSVSEEQPADHFRIVYRCKGDELSRFLEFPWMPVTLFEEQVIRASVDKLAESLHALPGSPSVSVTFDVKVD